MSLDHECCGYGLKLVCLNNDDLTKPVEVYRGKNAVYNFFDLSHYHWNNMDKKSRGTVKMTTNCMVVN